MGITSKPGEGLSGQSLSQPEPVQSPFHETIIKRREAAKRSYRAGSPRKVTPEEFQRILAAVEQVQPYDADAWRRLLRGLWLSTYGVGTLRDLACSPGGPAYVDATGEAPRIAIREGGFDSTVYSRRLVASELWEVIAEPPERRVGYVFKLPNTYGKQTTADGIAKTVSRICKAAEVVTDPATRLYAVSRDIIGGGLRPGGTAAGRA